MPSLYSPMVRRWGGVEGGGAEGSTEGVSGEGASWVAVAGAVGVRVVVGVEV